MTEEVIKSGTFRIKIQDEDNEEVVTSWRLDLLPRKKRVPAIPDHLFVVLVKEDGPAIRAAYQISLVDSGEHHQETAKTELLLFNNDDDDDDMDNEDLECWLGGRSVTFAELEALADMQPGDDLNILCELTIFQEVNSPEDTEEVTASTHQEGMERNEELLANIKHKCSKQLNQQLENSYRNGDFADVEVVCNTEVFKCHQFMLAARSPVLRAMFQSPMTEAATRRLEIKDLSSDVVDTMLLFIYTGNVPNLAEAAAELLEAAEKYQIDQLKDLCEQQLIEITDIGNAVAHLFLGDRFQAMGLRKVAMEFVVQHFKAVMANPEWKQKLIGHPALLAEITVEFLAGM
jgi:hypothetical protein